jgi:prepilin-type N-terminal cleavage/methylation domain-containing protein
MNTYIKERRDEGFTLIELLIAIVVVGILTAVVIVGIGGLNDSGKKGACQASKDAAKAAAAVYYGNHSTYASDFTVLQSENLLEVPDGVDVTAGALTKGTDWTITITGDGSASPVIDGCA